jgi:NADPH:quinone reductase-like Zn-dependent oxidoreductase
MPPVSRSATGWPDRPGGLGAYAEFAVLKAAGAIVRIPDTLGFGAAAGLCDGGLTALPFLRDTGLLQPGQHVLINGASGSVGSIAVQVAKAIGAIVTGVASARNLELVRSLGADRAIDYGAEDFTATTSAYDLIFDAVGKSSFATCSGALRPEGIYMTAVPSLSPAMLRKTGRRARLAATGLRPPAEKAKDLQQLLAWVAAGQLRTVVEREFELGQIADAHALVETGRKVGSAVVNIR